MQDGISAEIDRAVYIYAAGGPFGPKRGPEARVLGAPRGGVSRGVQHRRRHRRPRRRPRTGRVRDREHFGRTNRKVKRARRAAERAGVRIDTDGPEFVFVAAGWGHPLRLPELAPFTKTAEPGISRRHPATLGDARPPIDTFCIFISAINDYCY